MIKIYTEKEMLERLRTHLYMGPARSDASVTRTDFFDIEGMMLDTLHKWYRGVLMNAPVELVGVSDLAGQIVPVSKGNGVFEAILPAEVVRVVEVMLSGWSAPARIVEAGSREAEAQLNDYSRGGVCAPVAVRYHRRLLLYSLDGETKASFARLTATVDDGTYRLDESLLDFSDLILKK